MWSKDIVDVLQKIRKNSYSLHRKHTKRYIEYKALSRYFDLPVIVLSVFSSSFSSLNVIDDRNKNLITTSISMFIAVLTSIKLYLNLNNTINDENSLSKDYYILSIDIYKILNLDEENRNCDAEQFLNESYSKYVKLTEQSTILYKNIKRDELTIDMTGFNSCGSSISSNDSPKNIILSSCNEL
jgi:hypothetical protein